MKKSPPMQGKWGWLLAELQSAGMKTGNLSTPSLAYRALAKSKGIDLPKGMKAHPKHAVELLKEYRRTGVLRRATHLCKVKKRAAAIPDANSDAFLNSFAWRKVRYEALKRSKRSCCLCNRTTAHGIVLHVDHIKPRRKYPELALVIDNLQVLCEDCNHGKGSWDETDWR